jgi:hypothetical protein
MGVQIAIAIILELIMAHIRLSVKIIYVMSVLVRAGERNERTASGSELVAEYRGPGNWESLTRYGIL